MSFSLCLWTTRYLGISCKFSLDSHFLWWNSVWFIIDWLYILLHQESPSQTLLTSTLPALWGWKTTTSSWRGRYTWGVSIPIPIGMKIIPPTYNPHEMVGVIFPIPLQNSPHFDPLRVSWRNTPLISRLSILMKYIITYPIIVYPIKSD